MLDGLVVLEIAGGTNLSSVVSATDTITLNVADAPTFSGLVTANGGLTATGTINLGATAGNTVALGNTTGAVTVTGSSASSFVLDGTNVSAAEFNVLDAGIEAGDLTTQGAATDEYCLTYEGTSGALLEWQSCGSGQRLKA